MAKQQTAASDNNVFEPDPQDNDGEGSAIRPQNNAETKKLIQEQHKIITGEMQKRTEVNEVIAAAREKLVTLGIGKKPQAAVEAYLKLKDDDKRFFDEAVAVYRDAMGEPMQGSLALVQGGKA